ncbi:MAG: hypothetical protein HY700_02600 [Gemmatimonadetes bacterium]|nr:hypothetical protein [Gemmatimonadota bacterium]
MRRLSRLSLAALAALIGLQGCDGDPTVITDPPVASQSQCGAACVDGNGASILVDASHDGGVWWFPQVPPFDGNARHQGLALVGYLRSRGYKVDELGRGDALNREKLLGYSVVIRAGSFGSYSAADIDAYQAFVAGPRTLILLGEFLREGQADRLADALGIPLTGITRDTVVFEFAPHAITAGVGSLRYMVGSTLAAGSYPNVRRLGWLPGGEVIMGVVEGSPAKIFFMGDTNTLETVPQPLVKNLVDWGFPGGER